MASQEHLYLAGGVYRDREESPILPCSYVNESQTKCSFLGVFSKCVCKLLCDAYTLGEIEFQVRP